MTKFLSVALMTVGLVASSSSVAQAAQVECESDYGYCQVSNTDGDWLTCSCEDGGSDAGSGGDEWSGYSEAELLEVCESELAFCEFSGGGTGDPGYGTSGPGYGGSDSGGGGWSGGEAGGAEAEEGGGETAYGGETGVADDGGGETAYGDDTAGGDSGEIPGTSTTDAGGGSATTGADPTEGDDTFGSATTGAGSDEEGADDGQESGDSEDGLPDLDNLSCTVGGGSAPTLLGLSLFGLFGFARRRRH